MNGHFRALALIVVSVMLSGTAVAGWDEAASKKATELAQAFVVPEPATGRLQTPGLSVAVSRNGKTIFAKGFGWALPGVPVSESTVFQIGSLTKQFTAAAVLDLLSRREPGRGTGTVTLETPIAALLPGAAAWTLEGGAVITVRHLLSMTSNLPNFTRRPPDSTDPWGAVPAPKLLDALTQVRPSGAPGSFEYSNTSYFLLAELLESPGVGGVRASYREALRALWAKAGLRDTGFHDESAIGKRLAGPTYKRRPAFLLGDWLKGSADVASSALDLQAWNKALIEGQILSPEMMREMFSEAARVDVHTWYGMGWFVREKDGVTYYTHSGSLPGYTAFNIIACKGGQWSSATILTNSYGVEGLDEVAARLADMALHE